MFLFLCPQVYQGALPAVAEEEAALRQSAVLGSVSRTVSATHYAAAEDGEPRRHDHVDSEPCEGIGLPLDLSLHFCLSQYIPGSTFSVWISVRPLQIGDQNLK